MDTRFLHPAILYLSLFTASQRRQIYDFLSYSGTPGLMQVQQYQAENSGIPSLFAFAADGVLDNIEDKEAILFAFSAMAIAAMRKMVTKDNMKEVLQTAFGLSTNSAFVKNELDKIITADDADIADLRAIDRIQLVLKRIGQILPEELEPDVTIPNKQVDYLYEMLQFGEAARNLIKRAHLINIGKLMTLPAVSGDPTDSDYDAYAALLDVAGEVMEGGHPLQFMIPAEQGGFGFLLRGATKLLGKTRIGKKIKDVGSNLLKRVIGGRTSSSSSRTTPPNGKTSSPYMPPSIDTTQVTVPTPTGTVDSPKAVIPLIAGQDVKLAVSRRSTVGDMVSAFDGEGDVFTDEDDEFAGDGSDDIGGDGDTVVSVAGEDIGEDRYPDLVISRDD